MFSILINKFQKKHPRLGKLQLESHCMYAEKILYEIANTEEEYLNLNTLELRLQNVSLQPGYEETNKKRKQNEEEKTTSKFETLVNHVCNLKD